MELIIIIIDSKFNSNPTKHILDKIYITIIYIVPTKAPLTIPFLFIFIELNELADLIRGALFTVCPYTDATQSGVVYSSFALNTPVIATNVGGLSEMIDDGKTGIIVPPKDVDVLANAIQSYLDNPVFLQQMSENIAESARLGKGSWNVIAKEYVEIYNK